MLIEWVWYSFQKNHSNTLWNHRTCWRTVATQKLRRNVTSALKKDINWELKCYWPLQSEQLIKINYKNGMKNQQEWYISVYTSTHIMYILSLKNTKISVKSIQEQIVVFCCFSSPRSSVHLSELFLPCLSSFPWPNWIKFTGVVRKASLLVPT